VYGCSLVAPLGGMWSLRPPHQPLPLSATIQRCVQMDGAVHGLVIDAGTRHTLALLLEGYGSAASKVAASLQDCVFGPRGSAITQLGL
jgi:hypothetical protein